MQNREFSAARRRVTVDTLVMPCSFCSSAFEPDSVSNGQSGSLDEGCGLQKILHDVPQDVFFFFFLVSVSDADNLQNGTFTLPPPPFIYIYI